MLHIGTFQSDITPQLPVLMGGSFLMFEGLEVNDPILASCVVADDGNTRIAITSCDLGSVPQDMTNSIRKKVNEKTGTKCENIHLMATHNHSCPTVFHARDLPFHEFDEVSQTRREATRQKFVDDIADCIIKAHDNLTPALMGYGRGKFEGGAFNRRFIMSNGRSMMHGSKNLERLKPEGPADPEVQVVWFKDHKGDPLAVIVNYASHASNLYGKPIMSADFPGVMRDVLQSVLGKIIPILYLQGACGNIMCDDLENKNHTKLVSTAVRVGRGLAGEALRIMSDNFMLIEDVKVMACNKTLEIPYRVPPMSFEKAKEKWEYYKHHWDEFKQFSIEERVSLLTTLRLARYKQKSQTERAEIGAFSLGDIFFVTNQAELFVEYQLEIKEHFKGQKVIVTELTNGRIGYVPTTPRTSGCPPFL
jgi:neutral ceramidase